MSKNVLKGGVSYFEYVWYTEPNACEKCQQLNGKIYTNIDEIPDKPHPNCKCWLEVKQINENKIDINQNEDEEPCDCWEYIDILEKIIGNVNILKNCINEITKKIVNLSSNFKKNYESLCQKYLNKASAWDNALGDFARNYNDMVEANTIGADKYFHAKANCQAAQRGLTGESVSYAQSLFRELEEGTRKVIFEGEDILSQIKDAMEDMKANNEGRNLGKNYSKIPCEYLLWKKRPNGLDEKY